MFRSHRFPHVLSGKFARLICASNIVFAASMLSACTFGPRDPEAPPDNSGDKIAEASALEGSNKIDKDGFRTPDAKPVKEDETITPVAAPESNEADNAPAEANTSGETVTE